MLLRQHLQPLRHLLLPLQNRLLHPRLILEHHLLERNWILRDR